MTTTLTGKNQITIPAAVAALYHLKPGSLLEWLPGNAPDEICCRIIPDAVTLSKQLRGAGRKYLQKNGAHPLKRLAHERSDEGSRTSCL